MNTYVLILLLCENKLRSSGRFPPGAGEYTILVKAESYADAVTKLNVGEDCLCLTVRQVTNDDRK